MRILRKLGGLMNFPKFVVTLASIVTVLTGSAAAQVASSQPETVIVRIAAPIFALADASQPPLRVAKEGSRLKVLDATPAWYRVEFNDPQIGLRSGFIQKLNVLAAPANYDRMEPTDLSVADGPPRRASYPRTAEPEAVTRSMALPSAPVMNASRSMAQSSRIEPMRDPARAWLDVNLGMAMSAGNDSIFVFPGVVELASFYAKPSRGAEFDFGGGFMFTPLVGIGVSIAGAAHQDVVGLGAAIGNLPLAIGVTEKLTRTESAVNIQVVLVPIHSERFRARLFGGPSFFRYQADMVRDFDWFRSEVTSFEAVSTDGTGLGFHLGGDATYFFSRFVGLGAFARYSRASATIDEPMSEEKQKMTLGGVQTGGGLRFRF
jgi:hypothetical protein